MTALRPYRSGMRTRNQNSPLELYRLIVPAIRGRVVGDIGCGNGVHGYVVRTNLAEASRGRMRLYGVDFSAKAVAELRRRKLYDRAILASSERLPLGRRSVDTAMSIENLEHLFSGQVVPAIAELRRIARQRVLITTPWPGQVANRAWLDQEIAAAEADPHPIGAKEFGDLIGYLHKSTVLPASMVAAGFENPIKDNSVVAFSALYIGDPARLDLSKIQVIGLEARDYPARKDYRQDYLGFLRESRALASQMPWQWRMAAVHGLGALRRAKWVAKDLWSGLRQAS